MGAKTRKLSQINDSLIEWQSVVVADGSTGLTAVAGRGYFINTTSGTITVTLPSATAKPGDTIQLKDYARTWGTNAVSLASTTLDGFTNNPSFSTNGQTVTLVYMDNTRGWSLINEDTTTGLGAVFVAATGGTVLTDGDFKTHVFTGDGCFVVSQVGNPAGSTTVEYLVVAGGGAGGSGGTSAGGGGAGGYRQNYPSPTTAGLPVTATSYPITVGGGGAAVTPLGRGGAGNNSIFSTITSTGGGGGGARPAPAGNSGGNGGSGGGGGNSAPGTAGTGGTGNSPPVSPPQGNNGGSQGPSNNPNYTAGGGGGAGAVGSDGDPANVVSGSGGVGSPIATAFFGPTAPSYGTPGPASGRYFAGGGGSQVYNSNPGGLGGAGGGGDGGTGTSPLTAGTAGTTNTGGGGGGAEGGSHGMGGAGGKGIVVIRYQFQ